MKGPIFWPGFIILKFILGPGFIPRANELFCILKNLEKTYPSDSECTQVLSPWGWRRCSPSFLREKVLPYQREALVRFHVSLSTYSYRLHSQWRSATPPCGHPVGPRVLGTVSYSGTRGTQDEWWPSWRFSYRFYRLTPVSQDTFPWNRHPHGLRPI